MSSHHSKVSRYIFRQETNVDSPTRLRSNKPITYNPAADLASIHQTDRDIGTTKSDHSTLAGNDETHTIPTSAGIDSTLNSTILTAENDNASTQARQPSPTTAPSTNSKKDRVFMRILKTLLLPVYLMLCGWMLCLGLLFYIILTADEGVLNGFFRLFPDVAFFLKSVVAPYVCYALMTGFYFGV